MRFEQIDYVIRMICVGETLILGGIAMCFWVLGTSFNLELSKDAVKYWFYGLGLLLLLTLAILLFVYPDEVASHLPIKYAAAIVRIPIYACFALATAILIRAR